MILVLENKDRAEDDPVQRIMINLVHVCYVIEKDDGLALDFGGMGRLGIDKPDHIEKFWEAWDSWRNPVSSERKARS